MDGEILRDKCLFLRNGQMAINHVDDVLFGVRNGAEYQEILDQFEGKLKVLELFKLSVKDVENIYYLVYLFTPFYPILFSILPAITFSTYTQIIERS